jgi:hypothetical protein
MKRKLARFLVFVMACAVGIAVVTPGRAATVLFADGTFNTSNYSITIFQTGGATIDVSQALSGGNPGACLEITSIVPAAGSGGFFSSEYFLNPSFVYNPTSQGDIQSIDFAVDVYVQPSAGFRVAVLGGNAVIFQSGNY